MKEIENRQGLQDGMENSLMPQGDGFMPASEDHSYPVQDIMGKPPRWIVRWGIVSITTVIMVLLSGSAFFKYPDIVCCPISVTTENMPVHLAARVTGKIDTLLVEDGEHVVKGDILAVLENTANYIDVQQMKLYVDTYAGYVNPYSDTIVYNHYFPAHLSIGELQADFYRFAKAVADYRYFMENDYYGRKVEALTSRQRIQYKIEKNIRKQMAISKEQLDVQERLYKIDSLLFVEKAISGVTYEQSVTALLQMRQSYENAVEAANTSELTEIQTEQEIWELHQERQERKRELHLALSGAYGDLMAGLKAWEQNYVFRTPIDGRVSLTSYWQKNQRVTTGETLLSIVPEDSCRITGKIMLPSYGAGKVRSGQDVNVKFDGFPYMEYGVVRARIGRISSVPVQQDKELCMVVEVLMPDSLVTNYGKTLAFSQQMQGEAEIITADLSVLDRILNPIKSALKR